MTGIPVVALATAEMATVIDDAVTGFASARLEILREPMQTLLREPALARSLGRGARILALERCSIDRFSRDRDAALRRVTGVPVREQA